MRIFMGIDGGGSNLRVAITDETLQILGQVQEQAANPNAIGFPQSRLHIQSSMRAALQLSHIEADDIAAVGIGIAGAPDHLAKAWLHETVSQVLPQTQVICSSDHEIALVGTLGQRQGVLILSGTGSLAYGVNANGQSTLVGGWGYLLGDEGSGFWIAIEAIKAVTRAFDGRASATALSEPILAYAGVKSEWDMIPWAYAAKPGNLAQIVPLVLEIAESGDNIAQNIIERAANELVLAARTVMHKLKLEHPPFAFTGGLLERDTLLSRYLCESLALPERPQALYPPVIGATLLAREKVLGNYA